MRLFPENSEEKPGSDFYRYIIMIQIIILIYLFCFFTKLDGEANNITQSFSSNFFSGNMVIAVLFHIVIIFIDRYLYLEGTSKAVSDGMH